MIWANFATATLAAAAAALAQTGEARLRAALIATHRDTAALLADRFAEPTVNEAVIGTAFSLTTPLSDGQAHNGGPNIAVLLGSINRGGRGPLDPAQWDDWRGAVEGVVKQKPVENQE